MKVDLTPDELKQVQAALESNPVRRWIEQKDMMKFEIGDVVLKYHLRTDYMTKKTSWVVENINSDNKLAQRYVYIYEDEHGIGYFKQLRVANGTFGKELFCVTDFDLSCTKFEVDPEYAEHVLLDADFDIKKIHKASLAGRKIVSKMNRKIGIKPKTVQEFNDAFEKLKVGDTFWTTSDYTGRFVQDHTITEMKKVLISDLERGSSWDWKRFKDIAKSNGIAAPVNATYTYKISYSGKYPNRDKLIVEFNRDVIYLGQEPAQEKK